MATLPFEALLYSANKRINICIATIILLALTSFAQHPNTKLSNTWNIGFTENSGQVIDNRNNLRPDILFTGDGAGTMLFIRRTGVSYVLTKAEALNESQLACDTLNQQQNVYTHRVDMDFFGCNNNAVVVKTGQLDGLKNFYYPHCPEGITNVKSYNSILQKNLYNNIDILYKGSKRDGLKYDIIVNPGGKPEDIIFKYTGQDELKIENGSLIIRTSLGTLSEIIPKVYQEINNSIVNIAAHYTINEEGNVEIKVDSYQNKFPLIIDPWISYFGGATNEAGFSVANDGSGNAIFVGETSSINFPVLGAFQNAISSPRDGVAIKMTSAGTLLWATYYGGSNNDIVRSVATDKTTDDVYLAGNTASANFPVGAIGSNMLFMNTIPNSTAGFLIKLTSAGTRLWGTFFGGNGTNKFTFGIDVATDNLNNPIMVGYTNCSSGISTAGVLQTSLNGSFYDFFVAKFSPTGNVTWCSYVGGSDWETTCSVGCDHTGNIYLTGQSASFDYPVTAGCYQSVRNIGGADAALTKISPSGQLLWSTYYGGPKVEQSCSVAIDLNDDVYFAGSTTSGSNIATPGSYQTAISAGTTDGYLTKFSSTGSLLWATYLGAGGSAGNATDYITGIAIDKNNNVIVGGDTYSDDFPVTSCAFQTAYQGTEDQFIATFDSNGNYICSTFIGAGNASSPNSETIMGASSISSFDGLIYLVGYSSSYPTTVGSHQPNNAGGDDITLVQICANTCGLSTITANITASKNTICTNEAINFTVQNTSCDQSNTTYQWTFNGAGTSSSTDMNPINIVYPQPGTFPVEVVITTPCGADTIIQLSFITVNAPTTSSISVADCNSYTSPSGKTLTATGTYNDTIINHSGCDSIIVIDLTINHPVSHSVTQTICAGQSSLIHGINQFASGIYTQTFTAANGCDSIASVTLMVNNHSSNSLNVNSCSNYLLNGQLYSSSGIYTQTLVNFVGCDSILTLNLTINNPVSINSSLTICNGQSIVIHGVNQNTPGVYTQTFIAANGCDSISSVTLYVNNISSSNIHVSSCNNFSLNGKLYATSGIYTQTLSNYLGCDSLVIIDLTIQHPNTDTIYISSCGNNYTHNGISYFSSGIYSQTLTNYLGCDSFLILDLSLYQPSSNNIQINSCNSYTHNGQQYLSSGIYTQTLTNVFGCDSLLTINLVITQINTHDTIYSCPNKVILIHGTPQMLQATYNQTFTNQSGCDSVSSVTLLHYPGVSASFQASPQPANILSPTIYYTNTSIGSSYWSWNFGDVLQSTSSLQHTSYTYSDTGTYLVTLIASNEFGCSDTVKKNIIITSDFSLYVPNSFTPNGDGINEIFIPLGINLETEDYTFTIFDRWGNLIFKSNNTTAGWDGKANSGKEIAQEDVYVWKISLKDTLGNKHRYYGHVTLIR